MIERARARRAWEASLPPVEDAHRALERAQAMEQQEILEWKYRDEEIQRVQDQRLEILKQLVAELQQRKQLEQE
jgi:flagellar biosynthesis/type III secretory pathway chaperone